MKFGISWYAEVNQVTYVHTKGMFSFRVVVVVALVGASVNTFPRHTKKRFILIVLSLTIIFRASKDKKCTIQMPSFCSRASYYLVCESLFL